MDAKLFTDLLPTFDEYLLDIHTAASIGCDERVRDIIDNSESKCIVDVRNKEGWTPLMYAACCANLKVVLLLLEDGAETDLRNYDGHTALTLAAKCGSSDVINLLIDNEAKVNDKDLKGWTALFYAASFGHKRVVQSLTERGATVDIADDHDRVTPLMLAAASGHEMIVKDLLMMGANATVESRSGETAKSLAIRNGHINVKNLIDAHLYSRKKNQIQTVRFPDLACLLKELELSKYFPVFENNSIDLNTFWLLNDEDLKEIGIQLLGPRKKICMAISKYHQDHAMKNNAKEPISVDNVLAENKKLYQLTEKLKSMVLHEKNLRLATDRNLHENIRTIKNYSDNLQCTVSQVISITEKIKENHDYMRNLLSCTFEDMDIFSNSMKSKVELIYQSMECTKKLIEFQHQKLISLQQLDLQVSL